MIYRKVKIHNWTIRFLLSFDKSDKAFVVESLFWAEAPNSIIRRVMDNINAGHLNEGFCYSNPSLRRTVLGVGIAESGPEILDTMVHEIIHICQHIASEDGMDPYGEEVAYLGGHISREVSDIVCELSCPRCHKK
jgi:hypothetical protein